MMTDDDDSSVSSASISGCTSTGTTEGASKSVESIGLAKGETRVVNMLKGVVALVLVLATVGASFAVYRYTSNEENNQFEQAFYSHGTKVVESLKDNVEKQLATLDTFSIAFTTLANNADGVEEGTETEAATATATATRKYPSPMPFVTVPGFERRVHSALSQVKALSLIVSVLVEGEDRELWEEYAIDHFHIWSKESRDFIQGGGYNITYRNVTQGHPAVRKLQGGFQEQIEASSDLEFVNGITNHIWVANWSDPNFGAIADPTPGPYLVGWQNTPHVFPGFENTNMGAPSPFNEPTFNATFKDFKASLVSTRVPCSNAVIVLITSHIMRL